MHDEESVEWSGPCYLLIVEVAGTQTPTNIILMVYSKDRPSIIRGFSETPILMAYQYQISVDDSRTPANQLFEDPTVFTLLRTPAHSTFISGTRLQYSAQLLRNVWGADV